jgi:hypothetical protein
MAYDIPQGLPPWRRGAAAGCATHLAEAVIRAGMLKLGCGVLGELLAADPGYRGPRVPCGQGHHAEFAAYRDKIIDTRPKPS